MLGRSSHSKARLYPTTHSHLLGWHGRTTDARTHRGTPPHSMGRPSASKRCHLTPREVLCFGMKQCCTGACIPQPLARSQVSPGNGETAEQHSSPTHPSVCAAQRWKRPSLPSRVALWDRPTTHFQPKPYHGPAGKRRTYTQIDGYRYTRIHTLHYRPWEGIASMCCEKAFAPSQLPEAASGEELCLWGKPTPRPGHAEFPHRACKRPGGAGRPCTSLPYQPYTAQWGTPKEPQFPSQPDPALDEKNVSGGRSPLPGAQPARRRNPYRAAATRLPAGH